MNAVFRCWGTRGSVPRSGPDFAEFGGATSCYEVAFGDRSIVLDAGSGLVGLGDRLVAKGQTQIDLLLSHFHLDHVLGLPFFAPLFQAGTRVRIWSRDAALSVSGEAMFGRLFRDPFVPIRPGDLRAKVTFHDCAGPGPTRLPDGVTVETLPLPHPSGNVAFKLTRGPCSVVYSGDFEDKADSRADAFRAFAKGADLAVIDCTMTPVEVAEGRGFGHLDWRQAGALAGSARRWLGTHHHHGATDRTLRSREAQIKRHFGNGGLARDGMVLRLGAAALLAEVER